MSQQGEADVGERMPSSFIPGLTPYAQHHLDTPAINSIDAKELRKKVFLRRPNLLPLDLFH
jgi:hypothetical protein